MWEKKIIKHRDPSGTISIQSKEQEILFYINEKFYKSTRSSCIIFTICWMLSQCCSKCQSLIWGLTCSVNKYLYSLLHSGDPNIANTRAQTANSFHFLPKKSRLPNKLLCRQRPQKIIKKFTPNCRFVTLLW